MLGKPLKLRKLLKNFNCVWFVYFLVVENSTATVEKSMIAIVEKISILNGRRFLRRTINVYSQKRSGIMATTRLVHDFQISTSCSRVSSKKIFAIVENSTINFTMEKTTTLSWNFYHGFFHDRTSIDTA
jgi:hypothetical protein